MVNATFGTILIEQLNNPDCSMLSGITIGQFLSFRWFMVIILIYAILKATDKLVLESLLNYIKKKIQSFSKRGKR